MSRSNGMRSSDSSRIRAFFRHAGRHDHRFPHRFVVAPNFIATETNRGESALCAVGGSLRFHGQRIDASPNAN